MKFKYNDWRERHAMEFDKDKITLKKAGQEYNVYDMIQEAREDTELYPTLEKYGCIEGHMSLDSGKMYADFKEFKDLRTLKDMERKADEMFYSLPLEIRQKFNNDKSVFMRDGEKWLTSELEKTIPVQVQNVEIKEEEK